MVYYLTQHHPFFLLSSSLCPATNLLNTLFSQMGSILFMTTPKQPLTQTTTSLPSNVSKNKWVKFPSAVALIVLVLSQLQPSPKLKLY